MFFYCYPLLHGLRDKVTLSYIHTFIYYMTFGVSLLCIVTIRVAQRKQGYE
jgi:hypothetical protein